MEQPVRIVLKKAVLSLMAFLLLHTAFAQAAPELVFRNPVVEKGVAGQDGTEYRFSNITTGVDGILKIKSRSAANVELADIDVPNLGWDKALQPRLGISGSIAANQTWWMQFELDFVQTGTNSKIKLQNFVATSIDVDGDGVSIREFVQMEKMKSMAFSSLTYLKTGATINQTLFSLDNSGTDSYNLTGTDNMILGPVNNFVDIDTSATAVMATYTYETKNTITFVMGGSSSAAISSAGIAGLRLNSLWFKSFSLAPQTTLPVKLESFSAVSNSKGVMLSWKTASEKDFSHFVIERSVDGKSYSDIAVVFAAGDGGSANVYTYQDKTAASASVVYYRLRMVDEDRTFSYSFVSAVHFSKRESNAIAVYPNPTNNTVHVSLPDAWQGKTISLKIYNGTGMVALRKELKNAGATAELAIKQLPAGLYVVDATCNGEAAQQRVLKN